MPKKPKKKATRKNKLASFSTRKSVDIKKANNGFVVSTYDDNGEKVFIAKTKKEAQQQANKLLGF